MVTRAAAAIVLVVAAAATGCQGHGGGGATADSGSGSGSGSGSTVGSAFAKDPHEVAAHDPDTSGSGAKDDRGPIDRGSKDTPTKPDEPEAPDPGKMIDSLGAIPAWEAVIERANLLARRGQHGVAYGRLGAIVMVAPTGEAGSGDSGGPVAPPPPTPPTSLDAGVASVSTAAHPPAAPAAPLPPKLVASPYRWLVDDSDGNGALAIRVALGAKAGSLKEGDRVALGGAWVLDADHRWFWKVDTFAPLPAAAAPGDADVKDVKEAPVASPGHAIANGELPSGARTVSLARDDAAVYFQLVGPVPTDDAEGWAVADQLGNPTFAILSLPGERPAYGAQDMRAPDEHWALRRGQTYWVRIGKLHKHGADKPMTINARTPPVRVL